MGILGYILAIILMASSGYLLLLLIDTNRNKMFYKIEYGIYSFLIGLIFLTFLLFIMGWIGMKLSLTNIVLLTLGTNSILRIINRILKRKNTLLSIEFSEIKDRGIITKIGSAIFIIRLLIKLSFGFISIINVPTYQDDAIINRNYRAKVFFERESLVLDKTDKEHLGLGYKQYPLSPYLLKTYLSKRAGERKEGMVNTPSFIFYVCALLLVFFFILKETKKISRSLLATRAITNIPLYYIHGTNAYFDVFQSIYLFIAITTLYRYINKKISIVYPILCIGMLGYTKSEGLVIFMTGILITYLLRNIINKGFKKKDIQNFFKIALGSVALNIPLIIFKIQQNLGFGNGDTNISTIDIGFHKEIFPILYKVFFETGSYNLLFFSFLVIISYNILSKSIKKRTLWFLSVLTICFIIIISIYATTFTYQYVIDQTGINRSMMQLIPLIIIILILSCQDIYEKHYN